VGFYTLYSYRIVDHNIFDWNRRLPGLRIKTHGGELGSPSHVEAAIRPKERTAMILSQIEREILRQKDRDHQWDDQIDVSRLVRIWQGTFITYVIRTYTSPLPFPTIDVSLNIYHHPRQYHRRRHTQMRKRSNLRAPFAYVAPAVVVGL
jgi:hypothetical protein